MNQRARFIRKIVYVCIIAALLLPLSWLSQPETSDSKGGLLAQMRKDSQLGQASLGEIDPASETIKLATLGMRGVAANILWEKANYYKKVEDWSSYSAALEQITKLQPNFVSVWIFQGWNLSYNISVEFDDFRDRYFWVIKGVDFLKEGTSYNKDEPRLMSTIGHTIAQKIGKADEHLQFRRLFREDDDFNGSRPLAQRDNWLVGREWMTAAEDVVDKGVPLKGDSPLLFHTHPAMCLINYSEAMEEEGTFGEVAKNAWKKAADSWTELSLRDLPTVYGFAVRLGEKELFQHRSEQARAELDRLAPPRLREKIAAEKLAALSEQERAAKELPNDALTDEQRSFRNQVDKKLEITHLDIADRVSGENHAAALKAAEEAVQCDFIANAIETERGIINFDYWRLRCEVEPSDEALAARKLVYDGDKEFLAIHLQQAVDNYTEGFKKWRQVLDAHPLLLETDPSLSDELVDAITHYQGVLHQLDATLPQPFILQDVVDKDAVFHGPRQGTFSPKPTNDAKPVPAPVESPPAAKAPAAESSGEAPK